jgi:hypothetical protein
MRTTRRLFCGFILSCLALGCGREPQISADPACMKAVDALYTAILNRDPALLKQSEERLASLRQSAQLPEAAQKRLAPIIEQARTEKWLDAAKQLRDFMRGQLPPKV